MLYKKVNLPDGPEGTAARQVRFCLLRTAPYFGYHCDRCGSIIGPVPHDISDRELFEWLSSHLRDRECRVRDFSESSVG